MVGPCEQMEDGRIPKDIFCKKLASGKRKNGRPQLRFKDVCKRDRKALDTNMKPWEYLASNRSDWRSILHTQLLAGEKVQSEKALEKRAHRKDAVWIDKQSTAHSCSSCGRDCHSRIGFFSHKRRYTSTKT